MLPEVSHFIACKNYEEEKVTTIHTSKSYYDGISREHAREIRVLVVDDEYDVSLTIKLVLEENGFKVDSFTDASEALKNFTTGLYDLVILDVKMPEMSGFSLYKKIRKLDDKVIICYMTAVDEVSYEDLKKCYPNIDEICIIYKPVDNDSLLGQIKSIL